MNNYRISIQYDGTRYHGWQRQKTGQDTIQGKLEAQLQRLYDEGTEIDGAGRTDAGVHAFCQVANFRLHQNIEPEDIFQKMNEYLPEDIRILDVKRASERFHSRLNATGKIYQYRLQKKNRYHVFSRKYSWLMQEDLDVERMKQAAVYLIGQHDFKAFCTKASKKKSTVRTIYDIGIEETDTNIILTFSGNGFLYNMVRILTGTLVEVGMGTCVPESVETTLVEGNRRLAGITAPPQGLTLLQVKYD